MKTKLKWRDENREQSGYGKPIEANKLFQELFLLLFLCKQETFKIVSVLFLAIQPYRHFEKEISVERQ